MNKFLPLSAAMICMSVGGAHGQNFEDANAAVANMGIGWCLGNTLDSNSGDTQNMWIERWTDGSPSAYETAWGQPVTTRELIHMFKEAGFKAIRVPVTWYPHMGDVYAKCHDTGVWNMSSWSSYDVDPAWMARVREVVDYVIDEDMYCILNVHHDTGGANTAWLRASETDFEKQKERYESLWSQIATEFKDYDQHLIFSAFNEMLDPYSSWCFASFAAPGNYNESVATSAYKAINDYAQCFVDVVRSTGGNNAERNLVLNTYGSCNGAGTWNAHLDDPLKKMELPKDDVAGHLIFEVHSYFDVSNLNNAKKEVDAAIADAEAYLKPKGAPVIFGEWGATEYKDNLKNNLHAYARYFMEKAKSANIAMFYWMQLSEGADRSALKWSDPGLKDAIVKGYYGEGGFNAVVDVAADVDESALPIYNLQGIQVPDMSAKGIYIRGDKKYIVK